MRRVLLAGVSCLVLGLPPVASAQVRAGEAGVQQPARPQLGDAYRSYSGLAGLPRATAGAGVAGTGAPGSGAAGVTGAEVGGAAAAVGPDATAGAGAPETEAPGAAQVSGTLPGGIAPDQALGQNVYGPRGEAVAEIEDVLIDDAGKVAAVVLDVGGLLGLGERQVAVPVDSLRPVADGDGGASGGTGEGGGAAGVTGAAGVRAGTGAGARDLDAGPARDRPQLTLGMSEDELKGLPEYRRDGDRWVRQASPQ